MEAWTWFLSSLIGVGVGIGARVIVVAIRGVQSVGTGEEPMPMEDYD